VAADLRRDARDPEQTADAPGIHWSAIQGSSVVMLEEESREEPGKETCGTGQRERPRPSHVPRPRSSRFARNLRPPLSFMRREVLQE